jgi:hypothetical protein
MDTLAAMTRRRTFTHSIEMTNKTEYRIHAQRRTKDNAFALLDTALNRWYAKI